MNEPAADDRPRRRLLSRTGPASWWLAPRRRGGRASGSSTCARRPAARPRPWRRRRPGPGGGRRHVGRPGRAVTAANAARLATPAGGHRRGRRDRDRPGGRAASTGSWSTRPARGSECCAAGPTPAGGCSRATWQRLAGLQRRLLTAAVPLVRPGGVLSTASAPSPARRPPASTIGWPRRFPELDPAATARAALAPAGPGRAAAAPGRRHGRDVPVDPPSPGVTAAPSLGDPGVTPRSGRNDGRRRAAGP